MIWFWLDCGYACGGVIVNAAGIVTDCAPIWRRWLIGKHWSRTVAKSPRWTVVRLESRA